MTMNRSLKQYCLLLGKPTSCPLNFNVAPNINMKHVLLFASFALPFARGKPSAQLCSGTAEQASDGNWYCAEVWAITYRNISQAGVYNQTTFIDPNKGICGHERVSYGGTDPLTPLFGEVVLLCEHRYCNTDSRCRSPCIYEDR
jgi:hypothetical protein